MSGEYADPVTPARIVSLVPSLTELLFWLGAGDRVVGRTKFCTEPAGDVEGVPALGGTKNPDVAAIIALRPDLVVANKEENRREDVEALEAAGLRVLLTDPNTVTEAIEMVLILGGVVGAKEKADVLALDTALALAAVEQGEPAPVYVGVWHHPMMGLGGESYGHSLIEACGGRNVLGARPRYPQTSIDELCSLAPRLILLPDEPFPFDEGHVKLYAEIAPARVVDGKMMWWYGPRMPAAIRQLSALLKEFRT